MEYNQTFQLDSSSTGDAFSTYGSVGDLIQTVPAGFDPNQLGKSRELVPQALSFGIMGGKGLSF